MRFSILIMIVAAMFGCNSSNTNKPANTVAKQAKTPVPVYTYDIVKTYPHDARSFTQGLFFKDDVFYESAGEYGESSIRKVEVATGKVLKKHDVPREYFAEGMTVLNDKIYQITWQEQTAFVYDLDLNLQKEFRYTGEGWGLTHDNTNLYMSDGTHVIRVINPENFETIKTIVVKDENGRPVYKLNELEWVKGEIWANIWHSEQVGKPNTIARIDPATGNVVGWINLDGISPDDSSADTENTLNGIAYDAANDRIFVTGKRWKKLFEIKLKPKS